MKRTTCRTVRVYRSPLDPRRGRLVAGPIVLPYPASHERMWRDDRLYDVVLDLDWNRGPIRKGRGSAIFLHLAKPGFEPTQGCVAVDPRAIRRLLQRIGPRTRVEIIG